MTATDAKYELKQYVCNPKTPRYLDPEAESRIIKKRVIEEKIERLNQPFRSVLYYRYVEGRTAREIADLLSYSCGRIYQLLGRAIGYYARLN